MLCFCQSFFYFLSELLQKKLPAEIRWEFCGSVVSGSFAARKMVCSFCCCKTCFVPEWSMLVLLSQNLLCCSLHSKLQWRGKPLLKQRFSPEPLSKELYVLNGRSVRVPHRHGSPLLPGPYRMHSMYSDGIFHLHPHCACTPEYAASPPE